MTLTTEMGWRALPRIYSAALCCRAWEPLGRPRVTAGRLFGGHTAPLPPLWSSLPSHPLSRPPGLHPVMSCDSHKLDPEVFRLCFSIWVNRQLGGIESSRGLTEWSLCQKVKSLPRVVNVMQTWNLGFGAGHGEPGNENVVYLKVFRKLSKQSLSTKKVLQELVDSWLLGQLGQRVHYWLVRQLCGRQAAIHTTTGHRT